MHNIIIYKYINKYFIVYLYLYITDELQLFLETNVT